MFQTCNLRHFSQKETYLHWCKISWEGRLCLGVWVLEFSVTASGEESGGGPWIRRIGFCRISLNPTMTHFLPPTPLVPATRTENSPANAGDTRDAGLIPGLGRSPGIGNGNPLQYSCLGNPMDRGAWRATVHGVAKSRTWLSDGTTTTAWWRVESIEERKARGRGYKSIPA